MKKIYSFLLFCTLIMPFVGVFADQEVAQGHNSQIVADLSPVQKIHDAVEGVDLAALKEALGSVGPLSEGQKAIIILKLHKIQNYLALLRVAINGSLTVERIEYRSLSFREVFTMLGACAGVNGSLFVYFFTKWGPIKQGLVYAASLAALGHLFYEIHCDEKEKNEKIAVIEQKLVEVNEQLQTIKQMIALIENHSQV